MTRRSAAHYRGCLLGGAVGDALGGAVEFECLSAVRRIHGPGGIRDFARAYGRVGAITDDTQMTLWTAEGLLRARSRFEDRGIVDVASSVERAYLRWLETQGEDPPGRPAHLEGGWLRGVRALHARRAPGNTVLAALRRGAPVSGSKGCGTVMRVAPVGLVDVADPFEAGCEVSRITHGHPTGVLAGGFLAHAVARLVEGASLREATGSARAELVRRPDHEEVARAVEAALHAAGAGQPSQEVVESLGGGWVAEEALAIALYCALAHEDDLEAAVVLAVNHSGDSDSTGAITGNLIGLVLGEQAIPDRWLGQLELREEIGRVAEDLLEGWREGAEWRERYPPW